MHRPKSVHGFTTMAGWMVFAVGFGFCHAPGALAEDLTPPSTGVLDFDIVRKGDVIGHYHSDFVRRPDQALEVRTHVTVDVTMGPIRLYDFQHSSVETWRNGRLIGLVADTDDDGEVHHLQAEGGEQTLALVVDGKTSITSGNAVPSSLWSRDMLDGNRPIFDIGDGQIVRTKTQCDVPHSAQAPSMCEISGDLIRTLHFDPNGILVGLTFPAEDGSKVTYRPN